MAKKKEKKCEHHNRYERYLGIYDIIQSRNLGYLHSVTCEDCGERLDAVMRSMARRG